MELHWLPVYQRIDYKILTVMNQVHRLSFGRHQRSLLHHIDFHTAQTVTYYPGLHFPAAISLITRSHLRTITQPHTLHKPWTSFHRSPSIVLCIALPRFSCLSVFCVLILARVSWIYPSSFRLDSVHPCLDYCSCTRITPLV